MKWINFLRKQHVSWWKTVLFNFRALPWSQAIYLPIWVYSDVLLKSIGRINICSEIIESGMIRIGVRDFFTHGKFQWNNYGTIIFKGRCLFNGGSSITNIGGKIEIGKNVRICENERIIIRQSLTIGDRTRIAFGCLIMDTDFHYLVNINKGTVKSKIKPIIIGKYNWIGNSSIIRKGTITPDYLIVTTTSLLNKNYLELPAYSLLAGNPAKFISSGWRRIYNAKNEDIINKYFKRETTSDVYTMVMENIDWDEFCLGDEDKIFND